jgi:hypothetical protein
MPLRGPYKQYEVDTSISVPKSTSYDRRKRRLVEVLIDEVDINLDVNNGQEYLDEQDLQVNTYMIFTCGFHWFVEKQVYYYYKNSIYIHRIT